MNKNIIGIILISLILFSSISCVSADDDDRSYTIDLSEIFLMINPNGVLHVNESYTYTFDGKYNGVYRTIPIKEGESIENLQISVEGAYYNYEESIDDKGNKLIKVYLYEDKNHIRSIRDTTITVNYVYDFKGVIKIYKDVGELQYKIWGEEWDTEAKEINAHITFNSSDGIEYWINPYYLSSTESWDGTTLNIHTNSVKPGEFLEFRSIIPLNQFNNPTYANIINKNGYDEIHKIQNDYENSVKTQELLFGIVPIILILSLIAPIIVYRKYGKEPEIIYAGEYEREPPTDDSPLFVDAMFNKSKDIGKCSDNGFQAAIMDLINRKIIEIHRTDDENIVFDIKDDQLSNLKSFERDIVNILKTYEVDGLVDLEKMKSKLSNKTDAKFFQRKYRNLLNNFENEYIEPVIQKYFYGKGAKLFKIYGGIILLISIILLFISFESSLPVAINVTIASIIFIIIGGAFIFMNNRYGGRWTEYGKEKFDKWDNFKKYLNDFSLIKEYPPESVVVWNEYIVYATALGGAKKVMKSMEKLVPDDYLKESDLYYYNSYGGAALLASAIRTANTSSSSDGASSVGGGSGGGGGGAF